MALVATSYLDHIPIYLLLHSRQMSSNKKVVNSIVKSVEHDWENLPFYHPVSSGQGVV
jgi:hypothetical protein